MNMKKKMKMKMKMKKKKMKVHDVIFVALQTLVIIFSAISSLVTARRSPFLLSIP